jgi:hypothetical protein
MIMFPSKMPLFLQMNSGMHLEFHQGYPKTESISAAYMRMIDITKGKLNPPETANPSKGGDAKSRI